jgi:hypothetical protein
VQNPPLVVEARTVTGAIPTLLGCVPGNDAAKMSARRRDPVQFSCLASVDGDLAGADTDDARLPMSEICDGGRALWVLNSVTDKVLCNLGVFDQELRPKQRELSGGVKHGGELIWSAKNGVTND